MFGGLEIEMHAAAAANLKPEHNTVTVTTQPRS